MMTILIHINSTHFTFHLQIMAQVAKVVTGPCFHNATVEALCRLKLSRLCLITIQIRVLQK